MNARHALISRPWAGRRGHFMQNAICCMACSTMGVDCQLCVRSAMANPFPGMDPYLEGDLWTSVHTDLSAEIARQLAPKLRPKYVTRSARRIVLTTPDPTELPPE